MGLAQVGPVTAGEFQLGEGGLLWISGFDHAAKAATRGEFSGDLRPGRSAGCDDVLEYAIHGIFVENTDISIGMDIHFEGFELEAGLGRFIVHRDRAKVRKIGLGADGGVFGDDDRDLVSLVLIGERFDVWEWGGDPALGVTLVVA